MVISLDCSVEWEIETKIIMDEPQVIILQDQFATKKLGRQLAEELTANSILLLNGNLGAGKTTLIQGLGEELGITEPIVTPSVCSGYEC